MTETAAARRMRILEELLQGGTDRDLTELASDHNVDERTIRRDVDYLQDTVAGVRQVGLRVEQNREAKVGIARAVVEMLPDNVAIALTAGSTTYLVSRELRRSTVEEERPANLIAFTNSLPALMELIAADITTGVIGEI